MRIKVKKPASLTAVEKRRLSHLHLRNGMMYPSFQDALKWETPAWVIMAKEDDGTIEGWAFLEDKTGQRQFDFMIYVRKARRREGIGTRLLRKARKIAAEWRKKPLAVTIHDDLSEGFFKNQGPGLKKEYWY